MRRSCKHFIPQIKAFHSHNKTASTDQNLNKALRKCFFFISSIKLNASVKGKKSPILKIFNFFGTEFLFFCKQHLSFDLKSFLVTTKCSRQVTLFALKGRAQELSWVCEGGFAPLNETRGKLLYQQYHLVHQAGVAKRAILPKHSALFPNLIFLPLFVYTRFTWEPLDPQLIRPEERQQHFTMNLKQKTLNSVKRKQNAF